ncbi:putative UDP-glucuronosyltransferase ugt-58 [Trichinella patagoniensis]|uniref:glucuronosyltransferase n=1 Tax=Trichinella patagoniensis TaxID=990121 RepID=A0A0V0ZX05_9BILA|nr:putative UDP-glucuronosyltransferase ugt-58 [Trichinella patagoniensis]KRY17229.1 putative UDP-glucuronosyltransferase ugt-58 [Trichinella patagoniensis]
MNTNFPHAKLIKKGSSMSQTCEMQQFLRQYFIFISVKRAVVKFCSYQMLFLENVHCCGRYLLLFVFELILVDICIGGKVLFVPSSIYPSHKMIMHRLAEELVSRGHQVTFWGINLKKDHLITPKGIEDISWSVDVPESYITNLLLYSNASIYQALWSDRVTEPARKAANWAMTSRMCDVALQTRKDDFEKLVKRDFDLVIVDDLYAPCGLLLVALRKSVFIYWSMTTMRTETAWSNQSPSPPSYIPVLGTHYTDVMNFVERTHNFLLYLRTLFIHHRIVLKSVDSVLQKHYPNITEAFYIERNASLNFVNTPALFDFPRPFMPRVVFVGCLQCRLPKPLPDLFEKFVSEADDENGFLLFTTGFSVPWNVTPHRILRTFVDAFRVLPHRIVWQYNGKPIKDLSPNVMTSSWVPQQDLLGHPKCRGFITHGGLNSLLESMWHGVPVLGVPMFREHRDYVLRITARNAGLMLPKSALTKESVSGKIRRLTKDKTYKENALAFKNLLRDVPYTELELATFWVEFIFHHQEVPHARSGADELNLLQYFLVDVIAFLSACLFALTCITWYLLKYTYQACGILGQLVCRMVHKRKASKAKSE